LFKNLLFVGILQATEETNRIRIRSRIPKSVDPRMRIRTKMSRIHYSVPVVSDGFSRENRELVGTWQRLSQLAAFAQITDNFCRFLFCSSIGRQSHPVLLYTYLRCTCVEQRLRFASNLSIRFLLLYIYTVAAGSVLAEN
jgi:hypothetical protein